MMIKRGSMVLAALAITLTAAGPAQAAADPGPNGRFEGPHSAVDASILAKIKEKFPDVHAQYHEIRAKFNELDVIPPEVYAKYSDF
ncbi:hypothetical protein ACFWVT_20595 [Streptomyces cyaneofuscatus]|uniref:hypothetical protein n=1 Tax=Streptomyces cyaneofuscatus TaxID=66883 RepID=UPI00364C89DB